jgi:uncharacterized protein YgiM (DUF1202 family)
MAATEKYKALTDAASAAGVSDLQVREQDGIVYVDGTAPSGAVKDQLWQKYGEIDPNFTGGDLVMNIKVGMDASVSQVKVVTESSNLNIRKGPGTDQPIVGKAAHGETITLVSRSNDQWWLVRTADGEEGYAYAQYLEAVQ